MEKEKGFYAGGKMAVGVVYGETEGTLRCRMRELLWRPTGCLVRFVAVVR